jgi:hypothetical protein
MNLKSRVEAWKQNINKIKQGVQKVSQQKSMIKAKELEKVSIPIMLQWKRREWHEGFRFFLNLKAYACISFENLNDYICILNWPPFDEYGYTKG